MADVVVASEDGRNGVVDGRCIVVASEDGRNGVS